MQTYVTPPPVSDTKVDTLADESEGPDLAATYENQLKADSSEGHASTDPVVEAVLADCKRFGNCVPYLSVQPISGPANTNQWLGPDGAELTGGPLLSSVIELLRRPGSAANLVAWAACVYSLNLWSLNEEFLLSLLEYIVGSEFKSIKSTSTGSDDSLLVLFAGGILPKIRRLTAPASRQLLRCLHLAYRADQELFFDCITRHSIKTQKCCSHSADPSSATISYTFAWEMLPRLVKEVKFFPGISIVALSICPCRVDLCPS
jgi:hypothetical protein